MSQLKFFFNNLRSILVLLPDTDLSQVVTYRMAELNAIESMRTNLTAFVQFCMPFKNIDTKKYQTECLSRYAHLDKHILKSLCNPATLKEIKKTPKKLNRDHPISVDIICFQPINCTDLPVVNRINAIDRLRSVVFKAYLDENCDSEPPIGMRQLIDKVIPATFKKWSSLGKQIETGEIKFSQIDELIDLKWFEANTQRFLEEFAYICKETFSATNKIEERLNQVRLYIKFKSSLHTVQLINNIREKYQMKGKFEHLDTIEQMHTKKEYINWKISAMNDKVENAIRVIDSVNTPAKLACLQAFLDAHELVTWMRGNTRDLKQFKFLVDLILTSKPGDHAQLSAASKFAMAITLKDACVGYAALIYDLKPESDGFDRLVELCKPLWQTLDNDSNIAQKLNDVKGK